MYVCDTKSHIWHSRWPVVDVTVIGVNFMFNRRSRLKHFQGKVTKKYEAVEDEVEI